MKNNHPLYNKYQFVLNCEPRVFQIDRNSGWNNLVEELIQDLIKLNWDGTITQIKEKFGGLRFYIGQGNEKIWDRITEAEEKSFHICERCGKEGKLRQNLRWYLTLCDEHYEKHVQYLKENKL